MVKIIAKTPQELVYLGQRMAQFVRAGDLLALDGDLGAGKTTFTQGLAQGLGIEGVVNSPTFTILQVYDQGRLPLYHMDVYRLNDPAEMDDLGYEEYFYGDGVTVVEWASQVAALLPEDYLGLEISVCPEGRAIALRPVGRRYETLVEEMTGYDYAKHR